MRRPRSDHRPVPAGARRRRASHRSGSPHVLHRVRAKLDGRWPSSARPCSSPARTSPPTPRRRPRPDRRAAARRSGTLAAEHGVTVAFEALAWGRHVNRVGQAWERRRRARTIPAVTLAVDTFHMLARGDDGAALAGIPGDRIGFLQVADAPAAATWTCSSGAGTTAASRARARSTSPGWSRPRSTAGYRGPVSLEVFSDVVREADPDVTARDAYRSLVFLEDQLARRLPARERSLVHAAPPASRRTDAAFVEIADPDGSVGPRCSDALGFARAGDPPHASRSTGGATATPTWCSTGAPAAATATTALGIVAAPVDRRRRPSQDPAVARGRPHPRRRRGAAARRHLAGRACTCSSAPTPGQADDWRTDFVGDPGSGDDQPPTAGGWTGIDHVGIAVAPDDVNEIVSFLRRVFGLSPAPVEEFMGAARPAAQPGAAARRGRPAGRAQRRRPGHHGARRGHPARVPVRRRGPPGRDRSAAAGCRLMPVPDNYYVDLQARFDLDPDTLDTLRRHGVLYDRAGSGRAAARLHAGPRRRVLRRAPRAPRRLRRVRQRRAPTSGWRCRRLTSSGHPRTTYADWMRRPPRLLVLLLLPTLAACGSDTSASTATPSRESTSTTSPSTASSSAARARPVSKVLVVIEENHSLDQMSTGMPYTFGLAKRFGYATHYTAIRHPSLPNYVAIAGGGTFGIADDAPPADHPIHAPSVFGRAILSGQHRGRCTPRACRVAAPRTTAASATPSSTTPGPTSSTSAPAAAARSSCRPARKGDPVRSPAQRRHGHPGPLQRRPRLRPLRRRRLVPRRHAEGVRRSRLEVRPAGRGPHRRRGRARQPGQHACSRWCCTAASRRGWSTPR